MSIPTGPNSTLPRYATDTIPYIMKLNTADSSQDFPKSFEGKLVIEHATKKICEIKYSNLISNINENISNPKLNIYPNPFINTINIKSSDLIESIFIISIEGKIVKRSFRNSNFILINLAKL